MKLSDAGPMVQQVLRIAALHDFWEHLASMEEKVYLEFEAEIRSEQTHFLIEVDKESEDPELRAEDFIHLQHLAEITNTKGPTLVDAAYAATLHKIKADRNPSRRESLDRSKTLFAFPAASCKNLFCLELYSWK
jgi:hypothetical protein